MLELPTNKEYKQLSSVNQNRLFFIFTSLPSQGAIRLTRSCSDVGVLIHTVKYLSELGRRKGKMNLFPSLASLP